MAIKVLDEEQCKVNKIELIARHQVRPIQGFVTGMAPHSLHSCTVSAVSLGEASPTLLKVLKVVATLLKTLLKTVLSGSTSSLVLFGYVCLIIRVNSQNISID